MRPVVTIANDGNSGVGPVIPIDQYTAPTNIALGVVVTGTVNYTVQHTYDNVFAANFNPGTAVWFNHPTLAAQTANADSNYAFPPRGVRIIRNSGTGSAQLTLVQSGSQG